MKLHGLDHSLDHLFPRGPAEVHWCSPAFLALPMKCWPCLSLLKAENQNQVGCNSRHIPALYYSNNCYNHNYSANQLSMRSMTGSATITDYIVKLWETIPQKRHWPYMCRRSETMCYNYYMCRHCYAWKWLSTQRLGMEADKVVPPHQWRWLRAYMVNGFKVFHPLIIQRNYT